MDKRIVRTRQRLKTAFLTLLSSIDFEKLTVKDICQEAHVNRITFYDHYKDKYDILNSFFKDLDNESKTFGSDLDKENNRNSDPYLSVSNYLFGFVKALKSRKELLFSLTKQSSGYIYFAFISFLEDYFKQLVSIRISEHRLRYSLPQTSSFVVGGIISFIVCGIKLGKYEDPNYEQIFFDAQELLRTLLTSEIIRSRD